MAGFASPPHRTETLHWEIPRLQDPGAPRVGRRAAINGSVVPNGPPRGILDYAPRSIPAPWRPQPLPPTVRSTRRARDGSNSLVQPVAGRGSSPPSATANASARNCPGRAPPKSGRYQHRAMGLRNQPSSYLQPFAGLGVEHQGIAKILRFPLSLRNAKQLRGRVNEVGAIPRTARAGLGVHFTA